MSQTRVQKHFTISEVVADWHELMIPWCIMWPSYARTNEQLDLRWYPVAHKLLLISPPAKGRRLSTQQVSNLLKVACKWPAVRFEATTWKLRVRYSNHWTTCTHADHLPRWWAGNTAVKLLRWNICNTLTHLSTWEPESAMSNFWPKWLFLHHLIAFKELYPTVKLDFSKYEQNWSYLTFYHS